MGISRTAATSMLAAGLFATTVSTADAAHWGRRGPVRGLLGAAGALVAGAATVAILPFAIAASAARAATPPPAYYPGTAPAYYPPAATWYAAPPDVYGQIPPAYSYPPPPYNYAPGH